MPLFAQVWSIVFILIYFAGIVLLLIIMVLSIQALRLAIQALKKYLQSE